ncbi:hypothetical protein D3C76_790190 [compost metagenome]
MGVFLVAQATTLGREVELVPPLQLGSRWQRRLAGLLAADQVATHRHQRLHPLRPKRRDNVGGACAPVITAEHGLLDLQRIHEINQIACQCRRLAVAQGLGRQETRVAITASIRNQHAIALLCQRWRHIRIAVDVVRPTVQQDHHRPVGGTDLGIGNVQQAGLDVLERAERRVTTRCNGAEGAGRYIGGVCLRRGKPQGTELHHGEHQDGGREQATKAWYKRVVRQSRIHGGSPCKRRVSP